MKIVPKYSSYSCRLNVASFAKKRFVFATRASVGFLFPIDYGKYAEINFKNPGPSRVEGSARAYQILPSLASITRRR